MTENRLVTSISVLLVAVFTMYLDIFRIPLISYYLVNTPFIIFFLPYVLLIIFSIFTKKRRFLAIIVFLLPLLYVVLFAGRQYSIKPIQKNNDSDAEKEAIRICSWNTAYFFDWGKETGFNDLKEGNCDIILLQEVWRSEEHIEEIEYYVKKYLPGYQYVQYEEFLTIYSKEYELKNNYISKDSGFMASRFEVRNVSEVELINTHIWNPLNPKPFLGENDELIFIEPNSIREKQKKELFEYIINDSEGKLVAGDFNMTPNNSFIRELYSPETNLRLLSPSLTASRLTYSSTRRIMQIDYVYLSSELSNNASINLSCKPGASDHCLLIVDLLL